MRTLIRHLVGILAGYHVKSAEDIRLARFRPHLEAIEERITPTGLLPMFDIGTPAVSEVWVDPVGGNDANSGATRGLAVKTVSEAWNRVPMERTLSVGYRINLVAGTYPESSVPNYWEGRFGSLAAPIIVQAADGNGTAHLPNMNIFNCRYLYLVGLDLSAGGGDVLHLDSCNHILVRGSTIRGTGDIHTYASPQETLKANQSQYLFIENCDISGAYDNAVDFVAVQYGHVVGNRIHHSVDWAMYVKGGSAYLTIAGNEFYDAGTGGFTAGQGTGFEFMASPWLHYEAYDIKFINNIVHDTEGAGFGVNGGYNILLANNTLYRVGARSHVMEVVHGARTCDGNQAQCATFLTQGGWGTTVIGGDEPIPNRNVFIYNNVIVNPEGASSQWQQFAVAADRIPGVGSNIVSPSRADTNLQIKGNIIWNGPSDHPLGIDSGALADRVMLENSINSIHPLLVDPEHGDYRFASGFAPPSPFDIPDFTWSDAPVTPMVPEGLLSNNVAYDFAGAPRSTVSLVGAFAAQGEEPAHIDLGLVLSPVSPAVLGSSLTFGLSATNSGPDTATSVRVVFQPLPASVVLDHVTPSQGTTSVSGGVLTWLVGNLATGVSATLTVVVIPRLSGSVVLAAQATAAGIDSNNNNNSSSATGQVTTLVRQGILVTGADAGGQPVVRVYDAQSGAMRMAIMPYAASFRGGVRVAAADVTGDGFADIITVPGPGMQAIVRVFNGRTGMAIAGTVGRFLAFSAAYTGGSYIAAGDIDADGRADIIVGTDSGTQALVRVFNGRTGALLRSISPFVAFRGGVRVAAGDVNGDGRAEVIVAAGPGSAPIVKAYTGLTGGLLWSIDGMDSTYRGGVFVAAADVDGDGRADLMIGSGRGGQSRVRIFSGATRGLLQQFVALENSYTGGIRVAMVDTNGDGRADFVVGNAFGAGGRVVVKNAHSLSELRRLNPFVSPVSGVFVAAGYQV